MMSATEAVMKALQEFRDTVLHERGSLEGESFGPDRVNAVLNEFDHTMLEVEAALQAPSPVVMPDGDCFCGAPKSEHHKDGLGCNEYSDTSQSTMLRSNFDEALEWFTYIGAERHNHDNHGRILAAYIRSLSSPALTEQNIRALVDAGSDEAPFASTSTHASTSSPAPVEGLHVLEIADGKVYCRVGGEYCGSVEIPPFLEHALKPLIERDRNHLSRLEREAKGE